jgi:hypothetical protein
MVVRFAAPTSVTALLGEPPAAAPGSRDELRLARRLTRAMSTVIDAALAADFPDTQDPPHRPRRWTWLTRLMR